MATAIHEAQLEYLGYQQINVLSSAVNLTVPSGTTYALVRIADQNVRWLGDGTAPTSTVGMPLSAGEERWFTQEKLHLLTFIEVSAGAELNAVYYK